ncbi:hypothetical protein [Leptospira ilyithenensis]|uniref:Uncharacterized protein n=1 Tax=Leptospira ilyithenensis TaxID=2484901 RepID=A0A4R9LQ71_9LEPT|nr:hypothetical protein [Leptospira ilyithenensis]TGN11641.1 hypothetical protein EHS11_05950 [Leptospira ilyithenensis]
MIPLFGAVLISPGSEKEGKLLHAWLKYHSLQITEVHSKNWKDHSSGILFFSKPTPELAKELLEWSIEPLLFGLFTEGERENYRKAGVSLLWQEDGSHFSEFPIFPANSSSTNWAIFSTQARFDKHIFSLLRAMGEAAYTEGVFEHLVARIKTSPIHLVLVDWDAVPSPISKSVEILKSVQKEKQVLFLGLKNFDKGNLYRDLSQGITEISPSLFNYSEILEVISNSLPITKKEKIPRSGSVNFKKLTFEFQEKKIPVRYKLEERFVENNSGDKEQKNIENIRKLFTWLYGNSFD